MVLPISIPSSPASTTMSPASASGDLDPGQSIEGEQLGDPGLFDLLVGDQPGNAERQQRHLVSHLHVPRSIRPMAMRPRKVEKSRVETSIWNGPSLSALGGGT